MLTNISMTTGNKLVIFDSSGLISLIKHDDQLHDRALNVAKTIKAKGYELVLPHEVLAETLNAIGKIVDKKAALKLGNTLLDEYSSSGLLLAHAEPHMLQLALKKLETATGNPSFVDCLVMAYGDERRTPYIFGFDATFSKNGYKLPATR